MPRAWIGLGANLKDPPAQIRSALRRIGETPGIRPLAQSSLYRSAPLGPGPQDDYCNAACAIDTSLSADQLLTALHNIERSMGRERPPRRWAPRLIDLDLLHYEGVQVASARLTLPHPELARRNFVLAPLAEIAPHLEIPTLGKVTELAQAVGQRGLELWLL